MTIHYKPKGVCSVNIDVTVEDGVIADVAFLGGCNGNLQGVSKLAVGRTVDEVIALLDGINCNGKGTSCPDQLSKALLKVKEQSA